MPPVMGSPAAFRWSSCSINREGLKGGSAGIKGCRVLLASAASSAAINRLIWARSFSETSMSMSKIDQSKASMRCPHPSHMEASRAPPRSKAWYLGEYEVVCR
jgi:hypothetical protein